jgi:hypothetical protein
MGNIINWISGHQVHVFYMILVATFIINRLPIIGVFFRTVNTLLHESGHALGAILTSGEVLRIDILKNTAGMTETKSKGKFSAFIVSFAGYPFAALASSIMLVMSINGNHHLVMYVLFTMVVINLLFFVRNLFGVIWLVVFSCLLTMSVWLDNDLLSKLFLMFISLIAFTETFTSTLVISYLGLTKPRKAGDLFNMQRMSGVPAGFWALIIGAVVIWILYYTITHYFPYPGELFSFVGHR